MQSQESLTVKGRRMLAAIQEQRKQGGRVTDFCRTRRLSVAGFHWWKRRLREHLAEPAQPVPTRFVRLEPPAQAVFPFTQSGRIELSFPDGRNLRLPRDYSPADLVAVLRGSAVA